MYPMKRQTGKTISQRLSMFFSSNKGAITLRADNGSPFKNEEVMTLMESLGIGIIWSIPYKSNTNGVAERAVRSAKEYILTNLGKRWDTAIGLVELNKYLSMPKLPRTDPGPSNPNPSSVFQIGDEVWYKRGPNQGKGPVKHNLGGFDIITDIKPNQVILEKLGQVHPTQITQKCPKAER